MRHKKFILALQPHEAFPTHRAWSPGRNTHTLSFCALLLLLMGLAFPMTNPLEWRELMRVGLLKVSYGWNTCPYLTSSEATAVYTDMFNKAPKTGCQGARERDWKVICPVIQTQGMQIDCDNANPQGKADILRNIEQSRTTEQFACLYGN